MQGVDIYNDILKAGCSYATASSAYDIISRLNIQNQSYYEIHDASSYGCTVKMYNNVTSCKVSVNSGGYSFSCITHLEGGKREHKLNLNKEQTLDLLSKLGLINDIRDAIIEELQTYQRKNTNLIEHTKKIFDVLSDDFFDQKGSWNAHNESEPFNVIECYFNGQVLRIKENGFFGLYESNKIEDLIKEQKGKLVEFDEFVKILNKRNLINKSKLKNQCEYKDAELYIIDFG